VRVACQWSKQATLLAWLVAGGCPELPHPLGVVFPAPTGANEMNKLNKSFSGAVCCAAVAGAAGGWCLL